MIVPPAEVVVEYVGGFVVGTLFFATTAHLAATYVLGDVSFWRALTVGPVPAVVALLVGSVDPTALRVAAVLLVFLPADLLAIKWSYELEWRLAAGLTVGHLAISLLLAVSLGGLLTSLGLA